MRDLLDSEEFQFRYDIGLGQLASNFSLADKERIFHLIASHYAVIRVKAELDQIVSGLKTLGVLELLQRNPKKMRILLVKRTPRRWSADLIMSIFKPSLSEEGSNDRQYEEASMVFWANFLQLVEGNFLFLGLSIKSWRAGTYFSNAFSKDLCSI